MTTSAHLIAMLRDERAMLQMELRTIQHCVEQVERWGITNTTQDETVCRPLVLDTAYIMAS